MALGNDPLTTRSGLFSGARRLLREFGDRIGSAAGSGVRALERALRAITRRGSTLVQKFPVANKPLPKPVLKAARHVQTGRDWLKALRGWFYRRPLVRYISSSLLRRILISNLIGILILFFGIIWLSLNSGWVINAKRDALRVQGQIIAAAIAGDVKVESRRSILDPGKSAVEAESRIPFRDDGFAALELSIRPERVAPILRRLIEPTNTRARIYAKDGTLVVDSAKVLRSGQIGLFGEDQKHDQQPRTKNFWTRLQHWLINKEFQVYKEIGDANGNYYPEVRKALDGTPEAMLLLNDKGEQIVSQAVPIRRMNNVLGVLLLSSRPGEVDEILAEERSALWPLYGIALIASIITSLVLARTVAGPMKRLSAAARDVSRDINAYRALPEYADRRDEVGQMAVAFRQMTGALFRRIDASERFAADVAHELKNPLTAASSTAQSLEYAKTEEQREQLVKQILGELKRLNQLITDVSNASRTHAELARQAKVPVPLDEVLRNVVDMFESTVEERGCSIELDVKKPAFRNAYVVNGNDGRLAQVLTNLIDNALSFSAEGDVVRIHAHRKGDDIEITVDDEGPGIDPDKLETIFDRFYTYRPTAVTSRGNNSGLGLNIAQDIILSHGGQLWAENRYANGKSGSEDELRLGARFIVKLPGLPRESTRGRPAGARRS